MGRILFITGTGTGVGKTVLTALLLHHLCQEGRQALAIKPFCSGSRSDARLLQRLQKNDLTLAETNPFFFRQPVAPWVAARENHEKQVPLRQALRRILGLSKHCEILLVEGSGGILVPLGDNYVVADLMTLSQSETIVVAPNCLGTINHTMLTVKHLQSIGIKGIKIVMMSAKRPDFSSRSNARAIREFLPGIPVFTLPNLGEKASHLTKVKQNAKKMKKTLAQVLGGDIVSAFLPSGRRLFNNTR